MIQNEFLFLLKTQSLLSGSLGATQLKSRRLRG